MNIKIQRHAPGNDSTGGIVFINGRHFCYSCEDEYRIQKVMHETCIPEGRYQIKLRDEGGMTKRYAARFPESHKGMLWLQDVPGFEWVYIHIGNTDDDTSGCVLVGMGIRLFQGESTVQGSTQAYSALYDLVMLAMERDEDIWMEVG